MKQFLNRLYRDKRHTKDILEQSITVSVILFIALYIFEPFDGSKYKTDDKIYIVVIDSLLIFLCIYFNDLLCKHLSQRKKRKWRIKHQLFSYSIMLIALSCFFLLNHSIWFREGITVYIYIVTLYQTVLIAVFPALYIAFLHRISNMEKELFINEEKKPYSNLQKRIIELTERKITSDKVIFVKAIEKYIEINYLVNNKFKKEWIRINFKDFCEEYNCDYMLRSHRSYFINLLYVKKIRRNKSSGYIAELAYGFELPVSRSYKDIVLDTYEKYCISPQN